MSETEINNIFQSNTRHTSLDAPVHEAEDVAMGDLLEGSDDTDDDVMKDSLRNEIRRVLKSLSPTGSRNCKCLFWSWMAKMVLPLNRSVRNTILQKNVFARSRKEPSNVYKKPGTVMP